MPLQRGGVFTNLGSWMMSAMLRRLSDDWQAQYGHPLLVAESFVDPARFAGPCMLSGSLAWGPPDTNRGRR